MIGWLKSNWRVTMLVVFVLLSGFALFSPTIGGDDTENLNGTQQATGITNLQYGLDLDGGTRIRAPLVGLTAEGVQFGDASEAQVAADVAEQLPDTETTDIIARNEFVDQPGTVEMVNPDISQEQFAAAMDDAGYEYGEIRSGLTQQTRDEAISVLSGKVNQAGLSGSTVQQVTSGTGEFFILVEVPGQSRQDVIDLIQERGNVRIDIYHQNDSGEYVTERAVLTQSDFQSVSTATRNEQSGPHVPVSIRQDSAERFQRTAAETGVAQPGGSRCTYQQNPETTEPCMLLVVDDEVVNSFGMDGGLAQSMRDGTWARDSSFILTTTSFEEAQRIAINLRAGALPAELDIQGGTTSFISPTQGENFRTNALIVGILSVLAVAGVVFVRYREPKVALPMIVTAFSEVIILLGFAAYLGYPLDLAVIAGFIAVIGTGVDDLIIIADEVMSQGDVSSQKVFDSRFKRAFWVIGVAAATTIVAMSPLAVLSLGDLRGFAIFTILGVLVGVLITRPAYGDILRYLMTDR
jgi:preprotein translocase subunit SecD